MKKKKEVPSDLIQEQGWGPNGSLNPSTIIILKTDIQSNGLQLFPELNSRTYFHFNPVVSPQEDHFHFLKRRVLDLGK